MENNEQNIQQINDDEIDLVEILRQVWAGRWIILITTAAFVAIAVIYILYSSYTGTKEYESQVTLMVESPSTDSLITAIKSPLFISEVLKMRLTGLKPGAALTVAEILNQQTKPPQGNLMGLTNRLNAAKGDAGILVITVKMQDQPLATQLADSVVQKLTQFLRETQIKRAIKNQKLLAEDTSKNFQLLRDASSRNLQYLSKGNSKNIQYLAEGTSKEIQFLSRGATKSIEFQSVDAIKNIEFQNEGSAKNIQLLTEGYHKAETTYLQSQQTLADYYARNSKTPESIDSLEVKRLNLEIKLKYNVYSRLYQELESTKIEVKKQAEQVKLEADKQIGQAKLEADKQVDLAKLSADKQMEQAKLDGDKQLEQAKLEADKQFEQKKIDATKQIEQLILDAMKKVPEINVLEPATSATQVNGSKALKVLWLMIFIGLIVGLGIVFGKRFFVKSNFANSPKPLNLKKSDA